VTATALLATAWLLVYRLPALALQRGLDFLVAKILLACSMAAAGCSAFTCVVRGPRR